jgi:hypothetical protein
MPALKRSDSCVKDTKELSGSFQGKSKEEFYIKQAPQEDDIAKLREELSQQRDNIGLLKCPLTTIRLFLECSVKFSIARAKDLLMSWITWLVVVPMIGLWFAAKHILVPDMFVPPVCGETEAGTLWWIELTMKEAAWWIMLGILSSVGFGTGLHSGLMFLFPHVMEVVTAAEGCHTTRGLVTWYQHPCKFDCSTTSGPADDTTVTFLRLFGLVLFPCMMWGTGTAFGELPPYLVTKAARLAGGQDEDYEKEKSEAEESNDAFSKMKVMTIAFTEKYGFFGVFLLASWPNAAFDMCGMCCGYLLMPFWQFFFGVLLGKGVVKVSGQAAFFVNLFGTNGFAVLSVGLDGISSALATIGINVELSAKVAKGRGVLIRKFADQSRFKPEHLFKDGTTELTLDGLANLYSKHDDNQDIAKRVLKSLDKKPLDGVLSLEEVRNAQSATDGKVSLSSLDPGAGGGILGTLWDIFLAGMILYFVVSIVEHLAKSRQAEIDNERLEELEGFQKAKKN